MGANQFIQVASVGANDSGVQPAIDLVTLVPATGLDRDLTIICSGAFIGVISIEGSPSATGEDYGPITQFEAGLDDDENPEPLFFSAQLIKNCVVRRLRANIQGRIITQDGIGNTIVTVGAEQNCDCTSDSTTANWTLGVKRWYALDGDDGDDTNLGYSDVSMAAAGTVAKKTREALLAVIPPDGAGRTIVIAIKTRDGGATYVKADGTTLDDLTIIGLSNYEDMRVVATADFSDTATDRKVSGAVTAVTGPNADGSWTCAAGATTSTLPIAAGALPAEGPGITLYRIRFTPTTATVALRNATSSIRSNAAASIGLTQLLPVAPAAGDTFLIERAGVAFNKVSVSGSARNFYMRGIDSVSNTSDSWRVDDLPSGITRLMFCGARGASSLALFTQIETLSVSQTIFFSDEGSVNCGVGFRAEGDLTVSQIRNLSFMQCSGIVGLGARTATLADIGAGDFGSGCVVGGRLLAQYFGHTPGKTTTNSAPSIIGAFDGNTLADLRIFGGTSNALVVDNSNVRVFRADLASALSAVKVSGNDMGLIFETLIGAATTAGNYGIDLSAAKQCNVEFRTGVTVTGPAGDVLLPGAAVATHTDFAITDVIDNAGNHLMGTGGAIVDQCQLVTNVSGGALAVGDIVRSDGVTSGAVTKAQANTSANATGPLLVMVTAPADTAPGYAAKLGAGAWTTFDAAPAVGALAYLDDGTAGLATTTVPPLAMTNQKRRLGSALQVSGTRARIYGSPENFPVISDGLPP